MKHMEMMPVNRQVCEQKKIIYRLMLQVYLPWFRIKKIRHIIISAPPPVPNWSWVYSMELHDLQIPHDIARTYPNSPKDYCDSFLSQGGYVNKLQHAMFEI